MLMQYKF